MDTYGDWRLGIQLLSIENLGPDTDTSILIFYIALNKYQNLEIAFTVVPDIS